MKIQDFSLGYTSLMVAIAKMKWILCLSVMEVTIFGRGCYRQPAVRFNVWYSQEWWNLLETFIKAHCEVEYMTLTRLIKTFEEFF